MNCVICKGAHPDWEIRVGDQSARRYACKDHVSKVLSDIGKGYLIHVRGLP